MSTRYFRGGAPHLEPGDLIVPATDERHLVDGCPTCEARRAGHQLDTDPNNPAKVYVTTERDYARVFAAGYPHGALYVVDPIGELEPTRDDTVPSWSVEAARVVAVYDRLVTLTPKQLRTLVRRYTR